jgi:hypothetical protein
MLGGIGQALRKAASLGSGSLAMLRGPVARSLLES